MTLSALCVADLLTASPIAFTIAKMIGAAFLIWTRVRSWRRTARPPKADNRAAESIYGRAFLIVTINPKSVAGYFAAFTQFVQPDVPIMAQMLIIVPTALRLTAASY